MQKLFTYGTLQNNDVQNRLFGRTLVGTKDVLLGYELGKIISQGDEFNIANPKEGGEVVGVVYELSPAEIARADQYEDEAYQRMKVILKSGIESWVYVKV